jgi:hypothetical protein
VVAATRRKFGFAATCARIAPLVINQTFFEQEAPAHERLRANRKAITKNRVIPERRPFLPWVPHTVALP